MESRTTESNFSKQKHWANHISCWRTSGLTQRQYCLKEGIAISSLAYWIRKIDKKVTKPSPPRFYPLTVKDNPKSYNKHRFSTGVRLSLCDDRFKIDLDEEFSETTLRKLIVTLETV